MALVGVQAVSINHSSEGATMPPATSNAEYINGDWIVTDTIVTQDKEIILNGNLTVTATGNLTLSNVTLRINQTANKTCTINVEAGGSLYIQGGSNITSNSWSLPPNWKSMSVIHHALLSCARLHLQVAGGAVTFIFHFRAPPVFAY